MCAVWCAAAEPVHGVLPQAGDHPQDLQQRSGAADQGAHRAGTQQRAVNKADRLCPSVRRGRDLKSRWLCQSGEAEAFFLKYSGYGSDTFFPLDGFSTGEGCFGSGANLKLPQRLAAIMPILPAFACRGICNKASLSSNAAYLRPTQFIFWGERNIGRAGPGDASIFLPWICSIRVVYLFTFKAM